MLQLPATATEPLGLLTYSRYGPICSISPLPTSPDALTRRPVHGPWLAGASASNGMHHGICLPWNLQCHRRNNGEKVEGGPCSFALHTHVAKPPLPHSLSLPFAASSHIS